MSLTECAAVMLPIRCQAMPSWFPSGLSGWQHGDAASRLCQNTPPFSCLNFMGVQNTTLARYLSAEHFWAYCDFSYGHEPRSARELDLLLWEYINHLFHDDCPVQWSCDTLAAVRRFLLSWRASTYLSKAFLRNWSRINSTCATAVWRCFSGLACFQRCEAQERG